MKIGEVARRLGIPASTIRYYEKVGLIERQTRVSGRRDFDDRAMFTLQFVQLAQAAGFTLAETKVLLESYAQDPSPAGMWRPLAQAKQATIRQQTRDLQRMDRVLTELIGCKCATLRECVQSAHADSRLNPKKCDSESSSY